MEYIVHKPFKGLAICGDITLPVNTILQSKNGYLYKGNYMICTVSCENAKQHFAKNDDGNGLLRGKLSQKIVSILSIKDENYQKRWDKIWEDPICKKFKSKDHDDFWVWNNGFYQAHIFDLQYILKLIGGKL